jgi:hypothetical protein
MFPQRSQYLSSILLNCNVVDIAFIKYSPLKENPRREQKVKHAGVGLRAGLTLLPTTGLDSFAMTCSLYVFASPASKDGIAVIKVFP